MIQKKHAAYVLDYIRPDIRRHLVCVQLAVNNVVR